MNNPNDQQPIYENQFETNFNNFQNQPQSQNKTNNVSHMSKRTKIVIVSGVIIVIIVIVVIIIIITLNSPNSPSSNNNNNNNTNNSTSVNSTNGSISSNEFLSTSFNYNQIVYISNFETGSLLSMNFNNNYTLNLPYILLLRYGKYEQLGNLMDNVPNVFWSLRGSVTGNKFNNSTNEVSLYSIANKAWIEGSFGNSFNAQNSASIVPWIASNVTFTPPNNAILTLAIGPDNKTNPPTVFILGNAAGDYILYYDSSQNSFTSMPTPKDLTTVPKSAEWAIIPIVTTAGYNNPGFKKVN